MNDLKYGVLEKIEFQHPAMSKLMSFWHVRIIERGIPAKTFRSCFVIFGSWGTRTAKKTGTTKLKKDQ